jgi:hypothetical protein
VNVINNFTIEGKVDVVTLSTAASGAVKHDIILNIDTSYEDHKTGEWKTRRGSISLIHYSNETEIFEGDYIIVQGKMNVSYNKATDRSYVIFVIDSFKILEMEDENNFSA